MCGLLRKWFSFFIQPPPLLKHSTFSFASCKRLEFRVERERDEKVYPKFDTSNFLLAYFSLFFGKPVCLIIITCSIVVLLQLVVMSCFLKVCGCNPISSFLLATYCSLLIHLRCQNLFIFNAAIFLVFSFPFFSADILSK